MSCRYSQLANAMEHSCSCCKETRSTIRSIDLHCLNGDVIHHNYVYVEQCGCDRTECSQAASKARKRRSYRLVWWACEHVNTFSFWRFHNLHLNLAIIISSNKKHAFHVSSVIFYWAPLLLLWSNNLKSWNERRAPPWVNTTVGRFCRNIASPHWAYWLREGDW